MPKNHVGVPTYGKCAKKYVALIESHGYAFDRVNSKGIAFYTHPERPELRVNAGMSDTDEHRSRRAFLKSIGETTDRDRSKRHVDRVKERRAREREEAAVEAARIEAQRDELIVERERVMAAFGAESVAEANAIARQIEKAERELRYWQSLMTETPATGHGGVKHAAHRS
jgi:hypothetical protein